MDLTKNIANIYTKYDNDGFPINMSDGLDKRFIRLSTYVEYDADSDRLVVEDHNKKLYHLNHISASDLVYEFYLNDLEEIAGDILDFLVSVNIETINN